MQGVSDLASCARIIGMSLPERKHPAREFSTNYFIFRTLFIINSSNTSLYLLRRKIISYLANLFR